MLFEDRHILLAPMAGVSDVVFRQICREHGADLTYSEMVSAKGLSFANAKTSNLLVTAPNEDQIIVQLFGHEPDTMATQAQWLETKMNDKLYAIDINMGCPARKIASKGDGAALMRDPSLAASIISAVSSATSIPVTVKFRRGFEMNHETAVEFAQMAEASGASAVTIHGRYAAQLYHGSADWEIIAKIVDKLDIPVVGNGDITSAQTALAMVEQTGCQAIMIGRAAQGNPWIFESVQAAFAQKPIPDTPSVDERMDVATQHARLLTEREGKVIVRMRKHAMHYVAGLPEASTIRRQFNDAATFEDFERIFNEARKIAHSSQWRDYV